jgi:CRP-like cAMP-binding protein
MPVAWLGALALLAQSSVAYKYTTPDGIEHYVGNEADVPEAYRQSARQFGLDGTPVAPVPMKAKPKQPRRAAAPAPADSPAEAAPAPSDDGQLFGVVPKRTAYAATGALLLVLGLIWLVGKIRASGGRTELTPEDITQLWLRAIDRMAERRFDDAANIFAGLCEAEPNNLTFRQRLAEAQRKADQPEEAVATYQSVAASYAREGQLLKAIAINKVILEIDPAHQATQTALAKLYAQKNSGDPAAGIAATEGAIELPDDGPKAVVVPSAAAAERQVRLPETPIFSDLDPLCFAEVVRSCALRRFQAGEPIIKQGETGESFFVISSGAVKVSRTEPTGEQVDLARLGEKAFFGEMALLAGGPRTASVVAEEDAELLEFPAAVLKKITSEYPSAREAVDKFIRNRLLANVLATSPLFRPFDADERRRLIQRFQLGEAADGRAMLTEGTPGDGLYVVLNGRFRVQHRQDGGAPQVIAELREGELFGEISLLTGSNTTADVVAAGPAKVLRLPRPAFEALIPTHPQIRELAAQVASARAPSLEAVLGKASPSASSLMV